MTLIRHTAEMSEPLRISHPLRGCPGNSGAHQQVLERRLENKALVEVMPPGTAPCAEDEQRCPNDAVCYKTGEFYCLRCDKRAAAGTRQLQAVADPFAQSGT